MPAFEAQRCSREPQGRLARCKFIKLHCGPMSARIQAAIAPGAGNAPF